MDFHFDSTRGLIIQSWITTFEKSSTKISSWIDKIQSTNLQHWNSNSFYGVPTPNALPASYFRQFYPRVLRIIVPRSSKSLHDREISIWKFSRPLLFKRIYRNQRYREIGEINYPGSCHSTVARSFHPKAGSRRAISCGDAPTRAWRESDSKFHGVYIDSAELTLNTFARRAGGSHARRFVERHAFLNRDLSRPSLRNRWRKAIAVRGFDAKAIERGFKLNGTARTYVSECTGFSIFLFFRRRISFATNDY